MEAGDSKRVSYVGSTQTLEFVADMVLSGCRPSDKDVDINYDMGQTDEFPDKNIPHEINTLDE